MSKLVISEITEISDLLQVINLLRNGLKCNYEWSTKLFSHLVIMNKEHANYGFYLKSNNLIVGGIITIKQGNFKKDNGEIVEILNTYSFYVKPAFRGLPAIRLLKAQLDKYKNSILTSFPKGKFIFLNEKLGFKKMEHSILRLSFLRFFGFFQLNNLRVKKIAKNSFEFKDEKFFFDTNKIKDCEIFEIQIKNNKSIKIIGIFKHRLIKRIKIKHFTILWASDENTLEKVLFALTSYFFVSCRCLYLDYYKSNLIEIKTLEKFIIKRRFLIKNNQDLQYVPVLGSELSIGTINL